MNAMANTDMIELWRGSVNTWECDEMGHMNVRFYVAKAQEGLGALAHFLGLRHASGRDARAILAPRDCHIRFLKEARPGDPLFMRGGIVEVRETALVVYQELVHTGTGTVSATFRTIVEHRDPTSGRAFAWSQRSRSAAESLQVAVPAHGAPRSIDLSTPVRAIAPGDAQMLSRVGLGVVTPDQLDATNRMRTELFIGRVSDAVPNMLASWRTAMTEAVSATDGVARKPGAAVLEYRLIYRGAADLGDLLEVRSAIVSVGEKSYTLIHWIIDAASGEVLCTCEAVAVTFDLIARKVLVIPEQFRRALQAQAAPGAYI
jgi:acyl-CoA thioester hydrolase